ncbi:hypothetical protein E2542_SST10551 [Spatholobus suberectus]|nr:hypothetical protein E2542_SST10551 [Spatholobus suberectus]
MESQLFSNKNNIMELSTALRMGIYTNLKDSQNKTKFIFHFSLLYQILNVWTVRVGKQSVDLISSFWTWVVQKLHILFWHRCISLGKWYLKKPKRKKDKGFKSQEMTAGSCKTIEGRPWLIIPQLKAAKYYVWQTAFIHSSLT